MLCVIATGSIFAYVIDTDIKEGICPIVLPTSSRGSSNKVSKEVIGHRALGKRSPSLGPHPVSDPSQKRS